LSIKFGARIGNIIERIIGASKTSKSNVFLMVDVIVKQNHCLTAVGDVALTVATHRLGCMYVPFVTMHVTITYIAAVENSGLPVSFVAKTKPMPNCLALEQFNVFSFL
jgi:hypothetical protein